MSLGYATSDVEATNATATETEIDSYQVTLYGQYDIDNRSYVNAQVGYAFGDNETTRFNVGGVAGQNARADFDSNVVMARAEAGRSYPLQNGGKITPRAIVNYAHYDADSYTETGAGGLNLAVDTDSIDILELGVGADASWNISHADGSIFSPVIHAGVRHDVIGDEVDTTGVFQGGGNAFDASGFDPAQTTFDVGFGFTYAMPSNVELTVDYDYEFKEDFDSHSGLVKACLLYTSPSPRDRTRSRMPSSA